MTVGHELHVASMTLAELRHAFPSLFRDDQSWFDGEEFMNALPDAFSTVGTPTGLEMVGRVPANAHRLPWAVQLAHAYVNDPSAPIWDAWLWCRDTDRLGQRVFVGRLGDRFEIHRHIHITDRFGVPVWR